MPGKELGLHALEGSMTEHELQADDKGAISDACVEEELEHIGGRNTACLLDVGVGRHAHAGPAQQLADATGCLSPAWLVTSVHQIY